VRNNNSRLLWAAGKYLSAEERLDRLTSADAAIAARLRRSIRQTRRKLLKATGSNKQRPGPNHLRCVLVAVNDDPASRAAWRAAVDLATETGAKLVLLHVIEVSPSVRATCPIIDGDPWALRRAQAEQLFADIQAEYPATIPVRKVTRIGEPHEEIIETVREWHADLVVLGSHQRLPLLDIMMGSTTHYVSRHSKCPVVLVPQQPQKSGT
jgi:nucleotide-binding universal stress UspA family protein